MKILHVVPGLGETGNGIAVAAKMIAEEQGGELLDCSDFSTGRLRDGDYDEVWVHSMWLPQTLLACWTVIRSGRKLVRMPHGCLDPVRLGYHGWKKRLVAPIERWLLRHSDRIVTACEAEREWVRKYLGLGDCSDCSDCSIERRGPEIKVTDLKRFFRLEGAEEGGKSEDESEGPRRSLHLLYLGRRHPLKGVRFLERAVAQLQSEQSNNPNNRTIELRIVSDHFGEELEMDWEWCDVLCLPTLSENFGLVVAEALERGKRVVVTDGAPAWEPGESKKEEGKVKKCGRLIYLQGYREGTDEDRVRLLKEGLRFLGEGSSNVTSCCGQYKVLVCVN